MDWIVFLQIFTIANKCLLFPLFWFKKNNSLPNKLLALLILLPAVPVFTNYLIYTGKLSSFPYVIFIYQILINLFGPVFYYYCMVMIGKPFAFTKDKFLHLLPSLFPVMLWIDFLRLSTPEQHSFIMNFLNPSYINWRMQVSSVSPALFALPYMVIASVKVYRYAAKVKDVFTNTESLKINYVRKFVTLTLAELFVLLALHAFLPLKLIEVVWVPILGNIMYFYIVYISYNYSVIFSEKDYELYQDSYKPLYEYIGEKSIKKYTGSLLSELKTAEYTSLLNNGFTEQYWYLDPELNLKTVSEKSNIPVHYISQVINQQFSKNFFDYVNSYRIESLKQKLLDPSQNHIKIEALAYMSGFNSKAAFQRAFKKHVGMSPKEYRSAREYHTTNSYLAEFQQK